VELMQQKIPISISVENAPHFPAWTFGPDQGDRHQATTIRSTYKYLGVDTRRKLLDVGTR
jgi:hypothetical protein